MWNGREREDHRRPRDDRKPESERTRSDHLGAMLVSRPNRDGERSGNPVRIRDGPAAVRGDAPASRCHWPPKGWEGGDGRAPRVRRPPPAEKIEPLAEGGFVIRRSLIVLAALVAAIVLVPSALSARVQLKDGDTVLWYWATFGPSGGPPTLLMKRSGRCYSVVAQDDSGKSSVARGAVLHVGDRRAVATRNGRACVGPHLGLLVRATMDGAVRSNALP